MPENKIRTLIIDDSAFMRKIITSVLSKDPRIEVIGCARDGVDGLKKIDELSPDVITLDIEMPNMDGLQMLDLQMKKNPQRVVIVSSLTQEGSETTFRALELGAIDFVPKPSGNISLDFDIKSGELVNKIIIASKAELKAGNNIAGDLKIFPEKKIPKISNVKNVVVIGCSTGGPKALSKLIPKLDGDIDAAVLVVQHMPPFFTKTLAERLNSISAINVKEAEDGDVLYNGTVIIAKGGWHLDVKASGQIALSDMPPVKSVRPAVDVTMSKVAPLFGPNLVGVILTGMGSDGVNGVSEIKKYGGYVIAESQKSCLIYGMSKAVIEAGLADDVVAIEDIADNINKKIRRLAGTGNASNKD